MRANFIIAGTQKGGTTALAKFLSQHPQVCMSAEKELHFFDYDPRYFGGNGKPNYAWYDEKFSGCEGATAIGEATPIYMYFPEIAGRMRDYNPLLKLILILRNPIERAHSHYRMELGRGAEALSFSEAIRSEASRIGKPGFSDFNSPSRVFSYVDRGFYARQIKHLLQFFPQEQLLVLANEELSDLHADTMERVYAFLNVDVVTPPAPERVFEQCYESMSELDRRYLAAQYRSDLEELESLLDWQLDSWKS